ncbi:hypothetical protein Tco_1168518, partial [Tanacetum coccineum]
LSPYKGDSDDEPDSGSRAHVKVGTSGCVSQADWHVVHGLRFSEKVVSDEIDEWMSFVSSDSVWVKGVCFVSHSFLLCDFEFQMMDFDMLSTWLVVYDVVIEPHDSIMCTRP